jgi:hypothetical protein
MLRKLHAAIRPSPLVRGIADLGAVCRRAIVASELDDVGARVDYRPQLHGERTGYWDFSRLARAVSLLLEDAAGSVGGDDRVELRWRVHDDEAVVRIQYPRPLDPGDRLVTFFDDAREEGAPRAARERLLEARDIVLRHGGTLARVRTRRGTTYVVSLPREMASTERAPPGRSVSRMESEAAVAP